MINISICLLLITSGALVVERNWSATQHDACICCIRSDNEILPAISIIPAPWGICCAQLWFLGQVMNNAHGSLFIMQQPGQRSRQAFIQFDVSCFGMPVSLEYHTKLVAAAVLIHPGRKMRTKRRHCKIAPILPTLLYLVFTAYTKNRSETGHSFVVSSFLLGHVRL